jgi:hypothetical protein
LHYLAEPYFASMPAMIFASSAEDLEEALVRARSQQLCVDGDVRRLRPPGRIEFETDVRKFLVEPRDEQAEYQAQSSPTLVSTR